MSFCFEFLNDWHWRDGCGFSFINIRCTISQPVPVYEFTIVIFGLGGWFQFVMPSDTGAHND